MVRQKKTLCDAPMRDSDSTAGLLFGSNSSLQDYLFAKSIGFPFGLTSFASQNLILKYVRPSRQRAYGAGIFAH